MLSWLAGNEFAVGAVSAVLLGAVLAALKNLPSAAWDALLRVTVVNVHVSNGDESFAWLSRWLSSGSGVVGSRRLRLQTEASASGGEKSRSVLAPGPGMHLGWWRGRPIVVERWKDSDGGGGTSWGRSVPHETIRIWIPGRDPALASVLVQDAREFFDRPDPGLLSVYIPAWGNWRQLAKVQGRSPSTVFSESLPLLLADARAFLASGEWYSRRGIPWRRGWLLSGEPGGGKTSMVRAVATELRLDLYLLDLGDPALGDVGLQAIVAQIPPRSILLIEDVDRLLDAPRRKAKKKDDDEGDGEEESAMKVTLAGLLNALDGVLSSTGRILAMTTNHRDRIDPALVRPGRVDLDLQVGRPTGAMVSAMVAHAMPSANGRSGRLGVRWDELGRPGSMASVQQAVLMERDGVSTVEVEVEAMASDLR